MLHEADGRAGGVEDVHCRCADVRMVEVGERVDEENGDWGLGIGDWGDW
jgi:hypothetical protein